SSRGRHTRFSRDWSSDVCSSDLGLALPVLGGLLWRAQRRDRAFGDEPIARHLEATGTWRRGALTSLLEPAATGTSEPLHRAADQERKNVVKGRSGTTGSGRNSRI